MAKHHWIWLLVLTFGFIETAHFGWNFKPATDSETVCDGIVCILMALACLAEPAHQPKVKEG